MSVRYSNRKQAVLGQVRSPESECEPNRALVLMREKDGRDRALDRTRSRGDGDYKFEFPRPRNGRVYVKAKPKTIGAAEAAVRCRSDRSPTLVF